MPQTLKLEKLALIGGSSESLAAKNLAHGVR